MATSEDDIAPDGTRTSCLPGYLSSILTHLGEDGTEPTSNLKSASDDTLQDPLLVDNNDKSTDDIMEHADLTDDATCVDQSVDSTEADSRNAAEGMTRGQSTTQVHVEGNCVVDEITESEITDPEVDDVQRGDESNSTCEIMSVSFDNSTESPSVINVDQDEETCTELIESSIDDGVMSPTLSNVSEDEYSENEGKIDVESFQEGNTTEISGSGSASDLLGHSDISELIECPKNQNETPAESLGCSKDVADSVVQIPTEDDLNEAITDNFLKSLELQNVEPKASITLSNTPSKSNIVENVSESLLKPAARKSATSIKNIIDAFECKPLKDAFQVKPIRNIDTDKVESIEGIISQIDNDSCNNSMPPVKPTRQALNKVSDVTVLKKIPSDELASQNTETCNFQEIGLTIDSDPCRNPMPTTEALNNVSDVNVLKKIPSDEQASRIAGTQNFQELALPRYQIVQTKSEEEMCLAALSGNDEQKVLHTHNTTCEKDKEKESAPRVAIAKGVHKHCFMLDLIYWRDPKMTASVFVVVLAMLGVLFTCSIISIVAWFGLALIAAGSVQRVFSQTKTRQRRSNKLDDFIKAFSDQNVRENTDLLVAFIHLWFTRMRKIFLVDNIANTLQVAVMCYMMTYVGSWFNGVTVASILLTALFTLPKLYDTYERQIQGAVAKLVSKWNQLVTKAKRVETLTDGERINVQELF